MKSRGVSQHDERRHPAHRPNEPGYSRPGVYRARRLEIMSMKAVVCEAFGGPEVLALRELPDPPPPGPGEVQVRIAARGVQYVDVLMLAGKYQFRPDPPFIPGNEAAGEVVAVGDGVMPVQARRRVMNRDASRRVRHARQFQRDRLRRDSRGHERRGSRGIPRRPSHRLSRADPARAAAGRRMGAGPRRRGRHRHRRAGRQGVRRQGHRHRQRRKEKRAVCFEEGADYAIDYREGVPRSRQGNPPAAHDGVDICYDPIGAHVFDESLRCLAFGGRILVLGFLRWRGHRRRAPIICSSSASK